jgi:hypothetical protein
MNISDEYIRRIPEDGSGDNSFLRGDLHAFAGRSGLTLQK